MDCKDPSNIWNPRNCRSYIRGLCIWLITKAVYGKSWQITDIASFHGITPYICDFFLKKVKHFHLVKTGERLDFRFSVGMKKDCSSIQSPSSEAASWALVITLYQNFNSKINFWSGLEKMNRIRRFIDVGAKGSLSWNMLCKNNPKGVILPHA